VTSTDYSQQVPAAERTLRLLETLSASGQGMSTAELLEELGGSRSGLYALLNTLKARHYVESEDGRHRLGPALWELLPDRPPALDTLMSAFAEETRGIDCSETIALAWPEPGGTVLVAKFEPDRPVRVVYRIGTQRSDAAADGLVMAAGDEGDQDHLRRIRTSGEARCSDEEVTELAVPVCADGVSPTAALLGGVPSERADEPAIADLSRRLRQMAARLSYRLGAGVYQPYGWAASEPVGPTRDLNKDELDEFLRGIWGAQLACVRADGTPHVVPLWYEWDGRAMWLAASPGSSWRTHISENPLVSVTLDEPWPPLRRLFLSGRAEEVEEPDIPGGLAGLRRRLATRYLGQGAETRSELSEVEGWVAVRITPDRIHGRKGLGPTSLVEMAS
jgi:DNA-binding IclR family transcriptional regulator/nitroimidazol reductase NimA-like FMN-containing flavoprotein (pyridoxamine 5'-phosphate oxidase superfamily)